MNTDKLVELFKEEVEKLVNEAYEKGKADALAVEDVVEKHEYKTVKCKAKVGERVLITNEWINVGYKNGSVGTVAYVYDNGDGDIEVKEWTCPVNYREYEVIIEEQVQHLSANQQRKEMIEQAREFVESKKNGRGHYDVYDPSSPYSPWRCNVEFIINEEKRTVVALLKGFDSSKIYAKGIAKCHPDEVFNADIGKAIALARALEVDVPKEFLNAVQPDELVKGQYVELLEETGELHVKGEITEVIAENTVSFSEEDYLDCLDWAYEQTTLTGLNAKIINDTNAKY